MSFGIRVNYTAQVILVLSSTLINKISVLLSKKSWIIKPLTRTQLSCHRHI